MADHRILISDGLSEAGIGRLRSAGEVTVLPQITAEELLRAIGDYHALVVRSRTKVTAKVLGSGRLLRVVGRAGVGVDNIDVAAAQARGVIVVNSPLAATVAVAEHTLGLMLALARQIPLADARLKSGEWPKGQLMGAELHGKTLGLVAIGRIGEAVAERARAFGMSVIAYDPYLSEEQIRGKGARPAALDEVLARADFVSIHTPLTPETRGLFGAAAFGKMKRGAYVVCAARGGVIDEAALLQALERGQVAGAALDVFASEPPGLTPLVAHPNVICTPHIGAQTREAQDRAGVDIAEEVANALEGKPLRWAVKPE